MRAFSFGTTTILAIAGIGSAVLGIVSSEFRSFAIGIVLIFGAAVFAMLHIGTRWLPRERK